MGVVVECLKIHENVERKIFLDIEIILTILKTLLSWFSAANGTIAHYEGSRGEKEAFRCAPCEPEILPSAAPLFNS